MSQQLEAPPGICQNPDCTVITTGKCLNGYEDYVNECSDFSEDADTISDVPSELETEDEFEVADTDIGLQNRRFWSGLELGNNEARNIMQSSQTHLIALIGVSDVGKTCFLSSLFLKVSSADLPLKHYRFAGSRSLVGFEDRVTYSRDWKEGQIPEKLSERTQLQDDRQPGYMHLKLAHIDDPTNPYEILFTDLPGEWFESLIKDADNGERLTFLKRADGIVFFVDGERLSNQESQHSEIQKCRILIGRLSETIEINTEIPFIIAVSKVDKLKELPSEEKPINGLVKILDEAQSRGFEPIVIYIASFSQNPEQVENAFNVEETLDEIFNYHNNNIPALREQFEGEASIRSFARFRGRPGKGILNE